MKTEKQKRYALLSVSNKKGLDKFAKELRELGFELISSGGTAKFLRKAGVRVTEVSKLTKYPHMLDGRVKTLHPVIHGGILADQSNPQHLKELSKFGINPFQIVVCNLYPFEQVTSKQKFTHQEAIENIDIGGPTMVRASAKNYMSVAIVVDPDDYKGVVEELKTADCKLSLATKEKLSLKAFQHTKYYDSIIVRYLASQMVASDEFPKETELLLEKVQDLRYGENPHQKAAFYREIGNGNRDLGPKVANAKQLHGKELSFNNIVDMEAAWQCANYFADTTVAIIKHTNPCGVARGKTVLSAYKKALACDPVSAFGGIVASNRRIDEETAKEMHSLFIEVVIAPAYTPAALEVLKQKKNIRLIEMGEQSMGKSFKGLDYKRVSGGMLVQQPDVAQLAINEIKVVTNKQPSLAEMEDLFFAWGVAKHVKSNTIVFVKNGVAMGIGAGQMSRIEAAGLAVQRSRTDIKGAVLASDAFFPFADVVELAAKHGISAIIQPGGSKRDQESIDKANEAGLAMVFTGRRHFKH
ncbi:bifunctional phosphoribosylaminoimidazolecarboxamide formyltransferase/IMP cyclohydrolase [candidate division WOR-1 bacterium RIFOXYB2_FULL_42_35]|uniref:Bifunctional purine biosynthesis protein PurH n=1 Tax=candidate division WOR-1 bacterium RIFOXYC2_FULL_41_25 TaxID=1802586 RepID=A0A1F4TPX4_UNCSA|nr:MAG: bifunctional phosphoribosylaminoimidazolecarboxamide formyltransferase/IMP cyclohydrolase [candidate division WOR-1 bacterium RIFOXYA2_FULL_41_14]OGC25216.1 MAG: bifunctional phosphoribosylaminoimidazolecarboxamide formyltransferase/IMP cyclohydrolase [candidate division WOR-1 bacterium RIFOXYB2_FULL_42_35]OGC34772.1 MAG: bifunctional phosphoribosylaminoimidazolecarboxamide formyltransferase/IMP cyclohydrolase [candidate division WOR-1 bacterium RIFOXYC2_FULL_41_25]OGC43755.1 MAG: bifunc